MEIARIEVPARSEAVIKKFAARDDLMDAIATLEMRRDLEEKRLLQICEQALDGVGYVHGSVSINPFALDWIINAYDPKDGLLRVTFDDVDRAAFEGLDLRLKDRASYEAIFRVKPAYIIWNGGRRYAVERSRGSVYFEETDVNTLSELYASVSRTQIEIQVLGISLVAHDLKPFMSDHVAYLAMDVRPKLERGEGQKPRPDEYSFRLSS